MSEATDCLLGPLPAPCRVRCRNLSTTEYVEFGAMLGRDFHRLMVIAPTDTYEVNAPAGALLIARGENNEVDVDVDLSVIAVA